jgi:8-oxo-dGTP diphosphatase
MAKRINKYIFWEKAVIQVDLLPVAAISDKNITFAVIMARTACGWLFVRKKGATVWEIPGGHREPDETVGQTAARELYEETGSVASIMEPVTAYCVSIDGKTTFGVLCFAEIGARGALPESEIAEVQCSDMMPELLTYPDIQPLLFQAGCAYAQSWDYTMSDVF